MNTEMPKKNLGGSKEPTEEFKSINKIFHTFILFNWIYSSLGSAMKLYKFTIIIKKLENMS